MTEYFDTLETRDPELRERAILGQLPRQIAYAKAHAPAFARLFANLDPAAITTRAALATLPVTRKSELIELQKAEPPFGGFAVVQRHTRQPMPPRVFASPGPIREPDGAGPDYWRLARSLFAAGFRRGDLVHNTFSYHFTPAGAMLESGAHALGCTVFAAGTGETEQQVRAMAAFQPDGYVGTPSFLRVILDRANEMGIAVSSLKKALVSGEAFLPAVRDLLAAHSIAAYQAYATADVGAIAYETQARAGLIVDEGVLVELVRPGTGDAVAAGEVGEVIVTTLFNTAYPLIRFGTGDLSMFLPGPSPCGRTNARLKGWMGRADQSAKVRGMFVHPSQVAAIVARYPEILKARLVIDNPNGTDRMTLHAEVVAGTVIHAESLSVTVREITKLRGETAFCAPGELPNDGKVIDDVRKVG